MNNRKFLNAMTVDVEDYFHVAALSSAIDRSEWDSIEPRVENNTQRLLRLFNDRGIKATFFFLGWVAERFPGLVREIVSNGHELACHGFSHQLIYRQDQTEFRQETERAKSCLEDVSGVCVRGYRAASYSITRKSLWALDVIRDLGFDYDSSIVPARHDLYGISNAPSAPYRLDLSGGRSLTEFPPSTIAIGGTRLPIGGGGYFRIFPYWFSRWGMDRVNSKQQQPFAFYLHPWEIDPEQPRVKTSLKSRFRHYHNLDQFEPRLQRLISEFRFGTMGEILDSMELSSIDSTSLAGAQVQRV